MNFDDIYTFAVSEAATNAAIEWSGGEDSFKRLPMEFQNLLLGFAGTGLRAAGPVLINNALDSVLDTLKQYRESMVGSQYTMERIAISACMTAIENAKVSV